MESDSIRPSGNNTLIDIWIEGRLRSICVAREAIESFLGSKAPAATSEDSRCEFVRGHLPQVVSAVKAKLRSNPSAESIIVDSGELGGVGERRKVERRKTERRKVSRPAGSLPDGERRRSERRKNQRRKPKPSDS
ncbi:MAG TPA: hypothetical protein VFW35_11510 [Sphingomicrobium sp.]|nr:hypothetical protein [Sphingomicrobium sp.]